MRYVDIIFKQGCVSGAQQRILIFGECASPLDLYSPATCSTSLAQHTSKRRSDRKQSGLFPRLCVSRQPPAAMSQRERSKIFQKVDIGNLSAWLDLSVDNNATDANFVKAFKLLVLERRGKGADELWDLLRRAAQEENFAQKDRILEIMRKGGECFGLATEDFEAEHVDYKDNFCRANEHLSGLKDEFGSEIQQHIETRGGNTTLRQVYLDSL